MYSRFKKTKTQPRSAASKASESQHGYRPAAIDVSGRSQVKQLQSGESAVERNRVTVPYLNSSTIQLVKYAQYKTTGTVVELNDDAKVPGNAKLVDKATYEAFVAKKTGAGTSTSTAKKPATAGKTAATTAKTAATTGKTVATTGTKTSATAAASTTSPADLFHKVDPSNYKLITSDTWPTGDRVTLSKTRWFKVGYGHAYEHTLHIHLKDKGKGINHDEDKIANNTHQAHVTLNSAQKARVKELNPF